MMTKQFLHDGIEYELKAVRSEKGWEGEVFYQGRNLGARSLSSDTAHDITATSGHSATSLFFDFLESEFRNGRIHT